MCCCWCCCCSYCCWCRCHWVALSVCSMADSEGYCRGSPLPPFMSGCSEYGAGMDDDNPLSGGATVCEGAEDICALRCAAVFPEFKHIGAEADIERSCCSRCGCCGDRAKGDKGDWHSSDIGVWLVDFCCFVGVVAGATAPADPDAAGLAKKASTSVFAELGALAMGVMSGWCG